MKKISILLAGAILALGLSACGGGAASPPPFYTGTAAPTPTPTPARTTAPRTVAFAWSGQGHSASSVGRSTQSAQSNTEPIVVAAASGLPPNDPTVAFGQSTAVLTAKEVDSTTGAVVDSNPKTATAGDTQVASVSTPSPNTSAPPLLVAGVSGGSTAITTTFADGVSGSIATATYLPLHLACPSDAEIAVEPTGVALTNGKFVSVSTRLLADVYLTGPSCPGDFNDPGENTIHFPTGYQSLDATKSSTTYTSALPFVPSGTEILYSAYLAPKAVLTLGLLNVSTKSATFVKLKFTGLQGGSIATYDAMYVTSTAGGYPY